MQHMGKMGVSERKKHSWVAAARVRDVYEDESRRRDESDARAAALLRRRAKYTQIVCAELPREGGALTGERDLDVARVGDTRVIGWHVYGGSHQCANHQPCAAAAELPGREAATPLNEQLAGCSSNFETASQ